jgi:uncharacterized protein GlcG (DUF336 family)
MLSGGVLSIQAATGGDVLSLKRNSATNKLVLSEHGTPLAQFASGKVGNIVMTGSDGDDQLTIATNVLQPATLSGGAGNDVLRAGGGPTLLLGGEGDDKLIGGAAPCILMGGNGNDILVSKSGRDTLYGGPGADKLFAKQTDVLIGVDPSDSVFGTISQGDPSDPDVTLTPDDVKLLLRRAAAASASEDAIIAVVDRQGRILGVRVEAHVAPEIAGDPATLAFAIDGALSEARTGAFFANNQAPLTSRTIQFISQTTITQREVESNPDITDLNSTVRGPGFVAPVGVGGHFPPGVPFTPQVDLFAIEHTNRDSSADLLPGFGRFNANYIPGQGINVPDSYGYVINPGPTNTFRSRGIGTLPGGVPIFKDGVLVGGIGVFFPGKTGYATEENSSLSTTFNPHLPDRSLEAEYIAFAAAGGSSGAGVPIGALGGVPNPTGPNGQPEFNLPGGPAARIDLVGITLDVFGPGGLQGPTFLTQYGRTLGTDNPDNGTDEPVDNLGDKYLAGKVVPSGWLVAPHGSANPNGLTANDVIRIIDQGIAEANRVRAAIRVPLDSRTRMVFAVVDTNGDILGLYRMPDATFFSIDVAVAKARNVAYYANPAKLQPLDKLPGVAPGAAFTNRTFRYLAQPRFPEGIDGMPPGVFSILNDGGADPVTGLNVGPPLPASAFNSVMGHDAFNPGTDFHDPGLAGPDPRRFQNGIVFFPGSAPVYKNGRLVGGLGVSGDGVDEDDVVTFFASNGFGVPTFIQRADQIIFLGVRLPYQKFNRNPVEP